MGRLVSINYFSVQQSAIRCQQEMDRRDRLSGYLTRYQFKTAGQAFVLGRLRWLNSYPFRAFFMLGLSTLFIGMG